MHPILEKQIKEKIKKLGKQLYHYTSIKSFFEMVTSKELWLGYTKNLNDTSELTFFINEMKKALEKKYKNSEKVKYIFKKMDSIGNSAHSYVFCLSKLNDDAAMWERYADGAKGICVEFDTKSLVKICIVNFLWICNSFYTWKANNHAHYKYICDYIEKNRLSGFENIDHIIENFSYCGLLHKHHSFSSEKEVRIISLATEKRKNNIDYKYLNGRIKKIQKFNILELCKKAELNIGDVINKIIIGPKSTQSKDDLAEFLLANNCEQLVNKIIVSECPLR